MKTVQDNVVEEDHNSDVDNFPRDTERELEELWTDHYLTGEVRRAEGSGEP